MHLFILSHQILPQGWATRIVAFKRHMRSTSEYPLNCRKGWFSRGICRVRSGPFGLHAQLALERMESKKSFNSHSPFCSSSPFPILGCVL
jgi:hypothetical protein